MLSRPFACTMIAAVLLVSACAPQPAPVASAPPAPPPAPVPFDQAVLNAGNAVLTAAAAAGGGRRQTVVIDPLVNGVTGEQSAATATLGQRLADLARERYPQFDVQPFNAATVATAPLVMVGTFTPVNAQNQPTGEREAYRFCLVMADLKSGKTVAKSVARATMAGVDTTPTRVFRDSPAWTDDPSIKSYVTTCQGTKVGDPIPTAYLDGISTAALVSQAMDAYNAGRYRDALALYDDARGLPGGEQLRVLNGLYLTHVKLGDRQAAAAAFGGLVDYGLKQNRLGVKLLFRPASTGFIADPQVSGAYPLWLHEIAGHSAGKGACLEVSGHTSPTGSPALNERLSVARAETVKARLETEASALRGRVLATGIGAKQALVGTGADDASDALDRRVEFRVIPAC